MKVVDELLQVFPSWFSNEGRDSDVIISTRIRLARNIAGYSFPNRMSLKEKEELFNNISLTLDSNGYLKNYKIMNLTSLEDIEIKLLHEKKIISKDLVEADGSRGVIWSLDCNNSMLVNEEDHLRINSWVSGLDSWGLWEKISGFDDKIGNIFEYAYDDEKGFLVAYPTNSGCGFKISYLVYLPALTLTKEVDKILHGATHMGLSVSGFTGDTSEVIGALYLLSKSSFVGESEEETIEKGEEIIQNIIDYERAARKEIIDNALLALEDKVHRAYGILKHCRLLNIEESFNLLSAIRMGILSGILKNWSITALNRLFMSVLPAHLCAKYNISYNSDEEKKIRASLIKDFLPHL